MRTLAIIVAGAAVLAACSSGAPQDPVQVVAADPNNPLMAPGYLAMAASGDLFEIQSGQLAHPRAQSPAVHSFATMLTTDHTRSSQILTAAAQSAGVAVPPPAILPPHQAMLSQLNSAGNGAAFDMAFRDIQIQAHQQALTLHQNYAANGDVAALRQAAAQIVPVVQGHLQQLQAMTLTPPPPPPTMQPVTTPGERG
jgi:putative membrane protein